MKIPLAIAVPLASSPKFAKNLPKTNPNAAKGTTVTIYIVKKINLIVNNFIWSIRMLLKVLLTNIKLTPNVTT